MARAEPIDVTFNFTSDTPAGQDPDAASPTLRGDHRLLWSKPLPSGDLFELVDTTPQVYLHHRSPPREFFLSSDAVVPTFSRHLQLQHIIEQIPEADVQTLWDLGYTIGGMMVFPANRIDGKMTINGARGFHPRIKDRFDVTLECFRRHYHAEDGPLRKVLQRYADFFDLFGDFTGYVDFSPAGRSRCSVRKRHRAPPQRGAVPGVAVQSIQGGLVRARGRCRRDAGSTSRTARRPGSQPAELVAPHEVDGTTALGLTDQ